WLEERGPDAIVMACNTSCAIADIYGWPRTRATIFDIIDSAAIALQRVGAHRIGVIATTATVRTGAYTRRIHAAIAGSAVFEVAAPALVPLVEAGAIEGETARAAVADACAELPGDLDAVVLACTHYPILDAHFASILGHAVVRVDPALVQAERVAAFLQSRGAAEGNGVTEYVTNGDTERFEENVARIMKHPSHI
ncbi:MAG: aspartate/glutamate racemase family protein, partial [Candidatus Aquilonibacter sp.]